MRAGGKRGRRRNAGRRMGRGSGAENGVEAREEQEEGVREDTGTAGRELTGGGGRGQQVPRDERVDVGESVHDRTGKRGEEEEEMYAEMYVLWDGCIGEGAGD